MQSFEKERSFPGRLPSCATVGPALAVLASLALIAAGCGSNSPSPSVAQAPTTPASTTNQPSEDRSASGNPAAYSGCMRSHGVPKFPDPQPDGGLLLRAGPGTGIDPESPQFKAAAKACQKLAPEEGKPPSPAQQAEAREQMLKFAACMRSHGVPKFPDPTFDADGRVTLRIDSGLDPQSPQFKAAEKACQKLMPGRPGSTEQEPETR